MLGLPGMNARNRTPCFAFSISEKTSLRSGGAGIGFFDGVPFFGRGTVFCFVLGENQTRTVPVFLPLSSVSARARLSSMFSVLNPTPWSFVRSEEHTSELQSLAYLVCRL